MSQKALTVGRYEVVLILEGRVEMPADILIHVGGADQRAQVIEALPEPKVSFDVNCFALRDGEDVVLIDAGAGTAWGPNFGKARVVLQTAGIAPEQIKLILLTHLHGDHALGLIEGDAAYFPNAEICVPDVDFAYFTDPSARDATPEPRRGGFAVAAKVAEIYGPRVVRKPYGPVLPGIEARHLPGHTPGQAGYLIKDGGKSLLIWADALHLGDLQPHDPDIGLVFDVDTVQAAKTRHAMLEEAVTAGWLVGGSHITGFGHIERLGGGFRFVPI